MCTRTARITQNCACADEPEIMRSARDVLMSLSLVEFSNWLAKNHESFLNVFSTSTKSISRAFDWNSTSCRFGRRSSLRYRCPRSPDRKRQRQLTSLFHREQFQACEMLRHILVCFVLSRFRFVVLQRRQNNTGFYRVRRFFFSFEGAKSPMGAFVFLSRHPPADSVVVVVNFGGFFWRLRYILDGFNPFCAQIKGKLNADCQVWRRTEPRRRSRSITWTNSLSLWWWIRVENEALLRARAFCVCSCLSQWRQFATHLSDEKWPAFSARDHIEDLFSSSGTQCKAVRANFFLSELRKNWDISEYVETLFRRTNNAYSQLCALFVGRYCAVVFRRRVAVVSRHSGINLKFSSNPSFRLRSQHFNK